MVFDARQLNEPIAEPRAPRMQLVFAPSADEWIVATLKQWAGSRRAVVVTADRPLADRARHRGAEIVATDAFVALCTGQGPQD